MLWEKDQNSGHSKPEVEKNIPIKARVLQAMLFPWLDQQRRTKAMGRQNEYLTQGEVNHLTLGLH